MGGQVLGRRKQSKKQEGERAAAVHTQRRVAAWPGVPLAGGGTGRWGGTMCKTAIEGMGGRRRESWAW